ncbi:GTPase [uncultured Cellulomonas sp.]|uniref:GTPase n=1 Tax=uncultured Cellulomonas sp. TaxID=189682 RepID=UPI002625485C|nr:GTPase [uncultured Cellulomonas sp.]
MSRRGPDLATRVAALAEAVDLGAGRLPEVALDGARGVATRARERAALSPDHTVVALAGSTGSGKSSLLNALAGEEIARAGVTRPTTGHASAAVWAPAGDAGDVPGRDTDDAGHLLDWLEVGSRRYLGPAGAHPSPGAPTAAGAVPTGLVLLDLPDHDSVVVEHRIRAERLVERVDLLVWVMDPQKYADAALHERYLQPLAGHGDVVVLVLNQVDRLSDSEREACLADVRRLAAEDGLPGVRVLGVSAATGHGLDALRELLADAARRRVAATARLTADVRDAARRLADACGDPVPAKVRGAAREELVTALEQAAEVRTVVAAVRSASARRARAVTGWPPTRWLARLRPDPLRRLHLDQPTDRPDLARTSLPGAGAAARARASSAVRAYADTATAGAPDAWVIAAREAAAAPGLSDALDQAVAGTRLDAERRPVWWRLVGVLQWMLLAALVGGLAWLGVLAGLAYLRLPEPVTPMWWGMPAPTMLVAGGLLLGVLLALLSRFAASVGANRRAARARTRLRAAVARVTDARVVEPVAAELAALEGCRVAARTAAQ